MYTLLDSRSVLTVRAQPMIQLQQATILKNEAHKTQRNQS